VGYKRRGNISQSEICNLQEAAFWGLANEIETLDQFHVHSRYVVSFIML